MSSQNHSYITHDINEFDNDNFIDPNYFETFKEAAAWAKNNPEKSFTRSSDGNRYIIKEEEVHYEFSLLVAEMKPLGFTQSKDVSKYIVKNKLGHKYKHISGILEMEKDTHTWDFDGGFPPEIYRNLCVKLGLYKNRHTSSRVIKFKSYADMENRGII